jgi:cell cycle arrest protein BUB2
MGEAADLAATAHTFNKILSQPKLSSKTRSSEDVEESVKKLRRLILIDGIPSKAVCSLAFPLHARPSIKFSFLSQDPTLRYRIWKILLRVNDLPAETFLEYVARGPCAVREKIRNDTFRCALIIPPSPLMSSLIHSSVRWPLIAASRSESERTCLSVFWMLSSGGITVIRIRICLPLLPDIYPRRLIDRQESSQQLGFTYVQGMNVLAAPFLYTMPSELEAFFCFSKFIEESCPLYVQPTLEGVHRGLRVSSTLTIDWLRLLKRSEQLLDRCLKIVDPELFNYLRSKNLSAELYAFPCEYSRPCPAIVFPYQYLAVLTLCACTPPLDQVLQLWDFLLAFGVHLNVLCVIAQLLLIRDDVIASSSYVILPCTPPLLLIPSFPDLCVFYAPSRP